MSDLISIQPLEGSDKELAALQKVFESIPSYSQKLTGDDPSKTYAKEHFDKKPPEGVDPEKRFFYAIYFNHDMIGCFELIKDYPEEKLATLDHLVISYDVQGAGLGSEAYKEIEKIVREWEGYQKIRIPFVKTLESVMPFWRKMGYRKTSENSPYEVGTVKSKTVILEKNLNRSHPANNNNNTKNSNNRRPKYSNKKQSNRRPHSGGGRNHQNNNQNSQKAPATSTEGGES